MRCLSIWQPWASLIASGVKTCETRHWYTPYRGPLAIHAAKRWTSEEKDLENEWPFGDVLPMAWWDNPPLGCVVAVGELFACQQVTAELEDRITARLDEADAMNQPSEYHFGNYEAGRFMWRLRNVRALSEPIPARGGQGIWQWDAPAELGRLLASKEAS